MFSIAAKWYEHTQEKVQCKDTVGQPQTGAQFIELIKKFVALLTKKKWLYTIYLKNQDNSFSMLSKLTLKKDSKI